MTVREQTENIERKILSDYATLSCESRGRKIKDKQCDVRTIFQQDRDRIIHCKAFRRLKHKTQVFLSPESDHYRTRLTHTLEVAQIARTIARALHINEDLTEAIALGHDLGHTPFGHAGERALNDIITGGFRHYEQSFRVVDKLERDAKGLNLSFEVKNGILCHTRGKEADTIEGRLVKIADRIAYINHDIDDAKRAGILTESNIPKDIRNALGNSKSLRITTLVNSLIENSEGYELKMAEDIKEAFDELHAFMFEYVYESPYAKEQEKKVPKFIKELYDYFILNPIKLPSDLKKIMKEEGLQRAVCDYIAGMSDQFAIKIYKEVYIPKAWGT